jgi:hypothetical protein
MRVSLLSLALLFGVVTNVVVVDADFANCAGYSDEPFNGDFETPNCNLDAYGGQLGGTDEPVASCYIGNSIACCTEGSGTDPTCFSYAWVESGWSSCDTDCGSGSQSATWNCQVQSDWYPYGGAGTVVDGSLCNTNEVLNPTNFGSIPDGGTSTQGCSDYSGCAGSSSEGGGENRNRRRLLSYASPVEEMAPTLNMTMSRKLLQYSYWGQWGIYCPVQPPKSPYNLCTDNGNSPGPKCINCGNCGYC